MAALAAGPPSFVFGGGLRRDRSTPQAIEKHAIECVSGGLSGWGPAAVSGSGRRRHQARRSPPASFLALPWAACAVCTRRLLDPTRTTHEAGDAHPHTTTQDHSCAHDRQTDLLYFN